MVTVNSSHTPSTPNIALFLLRACTRYQKNRHQSEEKALQFMFFWTSSVVGGKRNGEFRANSTQTSYRGAEPARNGVKWRGFQWTRGLRPCWRCCGEPRRTRRSSEKSGGLGHTGGLWSSKKGKNKDLQEKQEHQPDGEGFCPVTVCTFHPNLGFRTRSHINHSVRSNSHTNLRYPDR